MALILSLETSAKECSVALHENGGLLETREIKEAQAHAAKLAVLITEIFKIARKSIKELKAVAISAGPGSYTGLRIGTSTAKGICYALRLPLISVSTLKIVAFQFLKNNAVKNGLLCPMIDAKRMEVYCQIMNLKLETTGPVESVVIDQTSFDELLKDQKLFFIGDGAAKCKSVINHQNAIFIDGITPGASGLGEMAFQNFEEKMFEDLVNFTPFYLKDFVAKKAKPVF
jgi:tRNA threonylcarbamoyladenosine biosynthesis protein TsaB